jgi:putative endonuclease
MDGDELVIVEVKSRSYDNFLLPEESVNHKKRLMIMRLTNEYVKSHNRNENVRFDIITIVKKDNGFDIKQIKNAYNIMSF